MHTVLLTLTCNPGVRDGFLPVFAEALIDTRKFAGCQLVEVYTDQENSNTILVWEKWESRAHQEKYMQWRMETGMLDTLAPVLSEPPTFLHLDHTSH